MDTSDQLIYVGCWVVLLFYIITTLLVFTRGSCVSCAASFLFACALSFDMALFNAWFLLPAFASHVREIDLEHAEGSFEHVRLVLTGEAARDIYLVLLGSFGSSLAIFNAASMLRTEGCAATDAHEHGTVARLFIQSVYQTCEYLHLVDDGAQSSRDINEADGYPCEKGGCEKDDYPENDSYYPNEKDAYPSEKDRLLGY